MRHLNGRRTRRGATLVVAAALALSACGSDGGSASDTTAAPDPSSPTSKASDAEDLLGTMGPEVLASTAKVAASLYDAALSGTEDVQTAVHTFLDAPTEANLAAARQAWLDARPAYLHTEALRFSNGPIDSGDNLEGFINAWPLDEQWIDTIIGGSEPVTAANLRADNEKGGETNISTGWHAVEYLLWGEDTDPKGPGTRPATDYDPSDPSTARRREYLGVVTDMLVDDVSSVAGQWDDGPGTYRADFVDEAAKDGIRNVLTGIGTLSGGELYSQRMTVPYDTKDHEDEHSCFSDNTTEDHKGDVESIRRIYLGLMADDTEVHPAITDLVKAQDPALDTAMRTAMDDARDKTAAIPRPFDQAILGDDSDPGRTAIREALAAIDGQTQALIAASTALGLQIGTEVP